MKIVNVGLNYRHSESFLVNRPFGSGDCILLVYKTPAFMELYGKRTDIKPNSVILFDKGSKGLLGGVALFVFLKILCRISRR